MQYLRRFRSQLSLQSRVSAISTSVRKLAVIIWNRVAKGVPYLNPEEYLFLDQKIKLGLVKRIQEQIDKFALPKEDLKFANI